MGKKLKNYHTISVVLFPQICVRHLMTPCSIILSHNSHMWPFPFNGHQAYKLGQLQFLSSWNPNEEYICRSTFLIMTTWEQSLVPKHANGDGWLPLTLFAGSSHSMLVDFNPALFPGQAWTSETHFTGKLDRSVSTAVQTSHISSFETAPRMDDGHETVKGTPPMDDMCALLQPSDFYCSAWNQFTIVKQPNHSKNFPTYPVPLEHTQPTVYDEGIPESLGGVKGDALCMLQRYVGFS